MAALTDPSPKTPAAVAAPEGVAVVSPPVAEPVARVPVPHVDVRLDKWLQIARLYKTRSQATKAIEQNRVTVNGQRSKAHRHLQLGDRIEVEVTKEWKRIVVVRELCDKILPKVEVPRLFEDLSPPKPQLDPLERLMRRPPLQRERGAGRPTKKERRELEKLRDE